MPREDVERLVRIETKLDQALSRLAEDRLAHEADMAQLRMDYTKDVSELKVETDKDVTDLSNVVEKLTTRVNSLENWRYAIAAALLMGAGGTIASVVSAVPK